ncbi:MAG TPA: heparinase [Hellea balneolensis]|uniref:Heparinase n=1 Tax=Hellea balneolensis TaxID=287478 RepID=A0A7C5QWE0_9PROT|nr:heparinase [Hellea balneolensis]
MTRRIKFSHIIGTALANRYWQIADDFGAPMRAIRLKVVQTPQFNAFPDIVTQGNLEQGLRILDGRFVIGSQILDVGAHGDPWSNPAPSERYARRLHSFFWLDDLASIVTDKRYLRKKPGQDMRARERARYLVERWVAVYGDWNRYAWQPDILTHRVYYWLKNWNILLSGETDGKSTEQPDINLVKQLKRLRLSYKRVSPGLSKFKAAATIVIAGACIESLKSGFLDRGLDWLDDEIEKQILLDGGHASRNVDTTIQLLEILMVTDSALEAAGISGSPDIRRAIDRIVPFVSFMCAPDGGTFSFNGSGIGQVKPIRELVARARVKARQFGVAPNSKYQRLERNDTVLFMDAGSSPDRPYDFEAHLAPLAFELANNAGRLIVNCGWNADQPSGWHEAVRATSAHSTLILDGANAGDILAPGFARRVLGDAIVRDAGPVTSSRKEEENGIWLEGVHEGYRKQYGLAHRRRIYMDHRGRDIRGEDSLFVPLGDSPVRNDEIPFEIRFHLHPDVKVTLAQDENSALLIQPGKTGWRFRTDAGPLKLEKSVYLAKGNKPRRTEQLVIYGRAYGDSDGQTKSNRVRWSLKRMGEIDAF